jgi:hypothetical protein
MDLFVQGRPVPMEPSSSRCTISHHRCSFPSTPGCWLTLLPTLSNVSGTPLDHRRRKSALRVVGAAILGGHHPLPLGFGRCQCISAPPVAGDTYTGFFFSLYVFGEPVVHFFLIFSSVAPHRGQPAAKCHPRWQPTRRLAVSCRLGRHQIRTRDCRTTVWCTTIEPPCLPNHHASQPPCLPSHHASLYRLP